MAGSCADAERSPLVCILGPTASGKTGLAVSLAERYAGEVLVMDSAQVYRGLPIGTAKPTPAEMRAVPHHLLGVYDWQDVCTAQRWADAARACIADIAGRGRLPILCGGTFLYLRALLEGLHALPPEDPALRQALEARAAREGTPALHAELVVADPETAARLHPNDTQRVLRALEIYAQTGQGREGLLRSQPGPQPWAGPVLKLALLPGDRAQLRERIARRFAAMLEAGLWDEARAARADPRYDPRLPVLKAVGYRQLFAAIEGRCGEAEAVERAIIATRQYAKRQLTWLRRDAEVHWLDSAAADLETRAGRLLSEWASQGGSAA